MIIFLFFIFRCRDNRQRFFYYRCNLYGCAGLPAAYEFYVRENVFQLAAEPSEFIGCYWLHVVPLFLLFCSTLGLPSVHTLHRRNTHPRHTRCKRTSACPQMVRFAFLFFGCRKRGRATNRPQLTFKHLHRKADLKLASTLQHGNLLVLRIIAIFPQ